MFSSVRLWCMSSIILLLFGSHGAIANKEYYSSVVALEELFHTEAFLLTHLRSYVESLTSQLEMLKSEIVEIEKEHLAVASEGFEEYHKSPLNGYRLIKRLHKDWAIYEQAIEADDNQKSFLDALAFSRKNLSYPTEKDSNESVAALVRLQETYQLDISQVAAGTINGVKHRSAMSWKDCFKLGEQLFTMGNFNQSILWFKESLNRLHVEEYTNITEVIDILDLVAYYHQLMGDLYTALDLTNRVIKLDPTMPLFTEYKEYLEDMIAQRHGPYHARENKNRVRTYRDTKEFKLYEKVCRGEVKQSPREENPLRCSYSHRDAPYRLLMPFKMEQINLDPILVVFHDVLSDEEIAQIKKLGRHEMSKSDESSLNYSVSHAVWLSYRAHPVVRHLHHRLGHISGLDMRTNEDVIVTNYGIGGQYEPHFDFIETVGISPRLGNRMATAIFYLSDVEQGGATAFPFLKITIQPKKGSIIFWYNLHPSGENDYRTKHAACPVLKGSKWIANVWMSERGQEFRRPCGLEQDHEVSLPYQYNGQ